MSQGVGKIKSRGLFAEKNLRNLRNRVTVFLRLSGENGCLSLYLVCSVFSFYAYFSSSSSSLAQNTDWEAKLEADLAGVVFLLGLLVGRFVGWFVGRDVA